MELCGNENKINLSCYNAYKVNTPSSLFKIIGMSEDH